MGGIPDYLADSTNASILGGYNDYLDGTESALSVPNISLRRGAFVLTGDEGEEVFENKEIVAIIIGAKRPLVRKWHVMESSEPDCFSDNGVSPDKQSALRQSDSCAECLYYPGTNSGRNPCRQYKVLAAIVDARICKLFIPGESFKNYHKYVRALSGEGIIISTCLTSIGIVHGQYRDAALTFKLEKHLPPEAFAEVAELAKTVHLREILGPNAGVLSKLNETALGQVQSDDGIGEDAPEDPPKDELGIIL